MTSPRSAATPPSSPAAPSLAAPGLRLAQAAIALWLVSLVLPGFQVDTRNQALFGFHVLLLGLPFGWMVLGFAVYANLFFLRAAYLMLQGRQPGASVVAMLGLAATLPFFRGVIRDEGSGTILPVASWGWGAALWLVALLLLAAAAALRAERVSARGIRAMLGSVLVALLMLAGLQGLQWSRANAQERSLYLSGGLAFTLAPRCGLPVTPVDAALLPPGSAVVLEADAELLELAGSRPWLSLPEPLRSATPGHAWVTMEAPEPGYIGVRLRVPASPERPVVQAKATPDGAVLRLRASAGGPVLYEQPLRILKTLSGLTTYCPMPSGPGPEGALKLSPDTQLLKALGQSSTSPRAVLKDEVARTPCNLGTQDLDGIQGLREWDGREVILQESVRTRAGFCSESYMALVYLSHPTAADEKDLSPAVQVFDRRTLRPLAIFNDRRSCRQARCPEAAPGTAQGVRIGDATVVVETRVGEVPATRR